MKGECRRSQDNLNLSAHRRFGRALLRSLLIGFAVVAVAAFEHGAQNTALAEGKSQSKTWVGTWATSPQQSNFFFPTPESFDNQTLRQIVHTTIGGKTVRVRFSNTLGSQPLTIDAASIGIHEGGGSVVPGTLRELTFGGEPFITISTGARVLSDPVDLAVEAEQDLAISLYVADESEASTLHVDTNQTSYLSPPGDFTADDDMPGGTDETTFWFWLTGVEVIAHRSAQAVVTLGDSITDGFLSTLDANARWPDELSRRLNDRPRGAEKVAVLNAGIGGNRVLTSLIGPNAQARLDRDVLTQSGVAYVILLEGINDIGFSEIPGFEDQQVSADDIVAGMKQIIKRAHARGLKIYGGTILPYKGALYYSVDGEAKRQAVNDFIRNGGAFDAVIDFDEAIRDPDDPLRMLPEYDSGDNLHPSDAGYKKMGETVDLRLFGRGRDDDDDDDD